LADLVDVILRDPDQWVRRRLDQHKVLSTLQLAQYDQTIKKWSDFLIPLQPPAPPTGIEKKRILTDPAVRVLADTLSSPSQRPCLLIHGPERSAHDVLTDLLARQGDRKPPKITRIDSRALLKRLTGDASFSAATFLDSLADESSRRTVWFLDSLHRYLADGPTPPVFKARFVRWLKQTDNRFIFAIPESQYNKHAGQHPDWKNTFNAIWVHRVQRSAFAEL